MKLSLVTLQFLALKLFLSGFAYDLRRSREENILGKRMSGGASQIHRNVHFRKRKGMSEETHTGTQARRDMRNNRMLSNLSRTTGLGKERTNATSRSRKTVKGQLNGDLLGVDQNIMTDNHTITERKDDRYLLFQQSFSFYVMGDAPYRKIYKAKVKDDLQHLSDGQFIVHVGDMNNPSKHHCSKPWFGDVHKALRSSPIPVLVVPGNNDILDCPDSEKDNFNKYFVQKYPIDNQTTNTTEYFEDHWNHDGFKIHRQAERVENWSFERNQILFIGMNLVAQPDLSTHWRLIKDNENWALSQIRQFNGTYLVMFGHQRPGRALIKPLFEKINSEIMNTGIKDVLYVHGNGHKYQVEQGAVGDMNRVQVDKGAAAPPLKITVRPRRALEAGTKAHGDAFEFDRRI